MYREYSGFMYVSSAVECCASCAIGATSGDFETKRAALTDKEFMYLNDLSHLSGVYRIEFRYDEDYDAYDNIKILSADLSLYNVKAVKVIFVVPGMFVLLEDGQKLDLTVDLYNQLYCAGSASDMFECICIEGKPMFIVPTDDNNPCIDIINSVAEKIRRDYAEREALESFTNGSFLDIV